MIQMFSRIVLLVFAVDLISNAYCNLLIREARSSQESKYAPTEGQTLVQSLYVTRRLVFQTFPKGISVPKIKQGKNLTKRLPVLQGYKELIDLYTTLKQLNSMEGSGNEEESTQLLFLKEVLMDGCEWMKVQFEVGDTFNCSNDNDAHRLSTYAALTEVVTQMFNAVKKVDINNDKNVSNYCKWLFCRINPECGKSDLSSDFYDLAKTFGCSRDYFLQTSFSCTQCPSD